jgi:GT2 family glycosyltransferase
MAKSTVIIPVFNQWALTKQCLETILGREDCEIIVVNDASTDETAELLASFGGKVKIITHQKTCGFAKGCNDGAALARTSYLVFLNNDTIPQPGSLDALVRYAETHPDAAAVGAKLLYPADTIQHAGVVICQDRYPRHIYSGFPAAHPAVNKSRRFQIVTAACMLVRREIFEAVNGFDERFRNGFEDVDFCLRLGQRGHEIHYCAQSVVQHLESVSPGRFKCDKDNVALYRERWLSRVQPDDFSYYLEDGLLKVGYEGTFPIHLEVSPELAVLNGGTRQNESEKLLAARARQVADLTREVTKVRAELGHRNPTATALKIDRERNQIRAQARLATPPDARILVVSKGDSALLELDNRQVSHFPQTESGVYLGHHPADSAEAIARLEALRARGLEYLLFPSTSFWWLEHYPDFARHLETVGSLVQRNDQCAIYSLRRLILVRPRQPARVLALLTTNNDERFVGNCLTHLIAQGLRVQLIDHESTDHTVAMAEKFHGRGLLGIESLSRDGECCLREQLARKEDLAQEMDADWFMHLDADEVPLAPFAGWTLADAFAAVAEAGYDTVNFQEFTFIPTAESPDHDHPDYEATMRRYYPFLPRAPWHVSAWRKQTARVDIASSGGHQTTFPGMRLCPLTFPMKHYQFLSVAQANKKYSRRDAKAESNEGNNGWRGLFRTEGFSLSSANESGAFTSGGQLVAVTPRRTQTFQLPSENELREFDCDERLDAARPRTAHFLEDALRNQV